MTQQQPSTSTQPLHPRMYWLHALTPLHVGAGRGVGYIDLPIMREKVTNWPLVPGSAVKGVLADKHGATDEARDATKNEDHQQAAMLAAAFGRGGDDSANAGCLVFTDARIVCLPVRSLFGTFAWVTSPMVLQCLKRDLEAAKLQPPSVPPVTEQKIVLTSSQSVLKEPSSQNQDGGAPLNPNAGTGKVYLEDLDLTADATASSAAASWANNLSTCLFGPSANPPAGWHKEFISRFAIVSDDVFNFLSETGTEVAARVKIDEQRKTVARGALWYEESLPAETMLGGLVWCDRIRNGSGITQSDLLQAYCTADVSLQIGGKATVGRGRARCLFSAGNGQQKGGH